jgi:SAM-dependent methyltransferase
LADHVLPGEIDGRRRTCLELLLLGQPVTMRRGGEALGEHLDFLLDLGFLEIQDEQLRADRYLLIGLRGRPFVVSRLRHARSETGSMAAYLGRDTDELYDWAAASPGRRVLDLGCGAGIVGILTLLSDSTRSVIGIDLCPEAVAVARFNAALNEVPYEALEGDLYAPVRDRQFDLVVADPPAVPLPDDLRFPVYGSGGAEGWRLLARVVEGVEQVLAPAGRLIAITELQCAPGRMPFYRWLEQWSRSKRGRQARVEVVASRLLPADYYWKLGANLRYLPGAPWPEPEETRTPERLASFAREKDLRFGHWVQVEVASCPQRSSSCALTWRSGRPGASSQPRLTARVEEVAVRLVEEYRHPIDDFGPLLARFVDQADGSKDLRAIAAGLPADALPYMTELTSALSQLGLVEVQTPQSCQTADDLRGSP